MAKPSSILEIEIDGPRNECLSFRPLPERRIRGRLDFTRCATVHALSLMHSYPQGVPGQRLAVDLETGEAWVSDPIHADAALKEKILKTGKPLAAEREVIQDAHLPSWLYWMGRAIESGLAKIIRGEMPTDLRGEPVKAYHVVPGKKPTDNLAAAIEANTLVLQQVVRLLQQQR